MARPLRIEYPGAFYHIIQRGLERKSIFSSDKDKEKFLSYLDSSHRAYAAIIHTYILKLTYPDSSYISYAYDQLNRLTAIKDQTATSIAEYSYDPLSRRTQLTLANNTQTAYQYDAINRLTQLANQLTGQQANYAYTYDKVGNRKTMTVDSTDTHSYSYDAIYQLTAADYPGGFAFADTNYTYDKVGNRTQTVNGGTTSYSANQMNQYTQVAGTAYTYDANGNLTNDATQTYAYDYENRLTGATKTGMSAAYAYDPFGRRISSSLRGAEGDEAISYIYDGDQVIAETDSSGSTTAKYIYGPGIDEPISMQRGGQTYYYHFDGLGSVTALTDSSGSTVETYSYDAYGLPNATSGVGNPYLFTGREYDSETGLYYYRARYYSPSIGRFLQRDPVGYIAGINLYSYVVNNPVNFVDPFGWDKDKPWWEKAWDWWSDLVAPGEGGVIPAKPGESWEEYFERFRRERIYEFAASEAIGLVGGWTSIGTTAAHSSFTEGLRLTGSQLGNRFVSVGGKGFWYMRGVTGAMKWRLVASGAQKGSAVTWVITSGATGYRIGLQLDAWLSYKWTKRQ